MIMCIVQAQASLYSSHVVHPLLLLSHIKFSNMLPSTCYHVVSYSFGKAVNFTSHVIEWAGLCLIAASSLQTSRSCRVQLEKIVSNVSLSVELFSGGSWGRVHSMVIDPYRG